MSLGLNHIAIVVENIESALKIYHDILGLPLEHVEEVPTEGVRVAFLPLADSQSYLELIQPTTADSGVAKYLAKQGSGLHHVCLTVNSLDEKIKDLQAQGLTILSAEAQTNTQGQKYAFIHPKTTHGVLLELYEKSPQVPSTSTYDEQARQELELAHQQAMQYGQDMVEIYKQERAKREALEIAYKKLEGALDSMTDGFLVLDKSLKVSEINRACADLFDINLQDAAQKPLPSLIAGEDLQALYNQLQRQPATKFSFQIEILVPTTKILSVDAAPLPDENWVLVLHDVTWEKRVTNMREEFLNLAAHELRTPLAGIIGFTSLLEQTTDEQLLDDDARSILRNILKSAERLRSTIKDLLDFTLNEAEDLQVQYIDLRYVVENSLALLSKLVAEHQIEIIVDFPDGQMNVCGHSKLLTTAIGHIIENAIRYNTQAGKVIISGEAGEMHHTLNITDTGVGISRKELEYIFQPFFQIDEHTTRRSVGMGLGLSIAKRTINIHQGILTATSKLNKGSTFQIKLPFIEHINIEKMRQDLVAIQSTLKKQTPENPSEQQTEGLIEQLKLQLEATQTQNVAYARDLAQLYQLQRTESKKVKEQSAIITHTDRLALMGQLAAGVAHDLSNLIGPILGYSQIILRQRDSIDPAITTITERILSTSRRANILLRQMVNLSGTHSDTFEAIDMSQLLQETLLILEAKIRKNNIDLMETYASEVDLIHGNQVQVSQVILNIVVNAIDSMPGGGVLTINIAPKDYEGQLYTQIQIADTGPGIAPENLPHIFDSFFTTKSEKGGTGLGLSLSKEIVEHHRGEILVDSILDKGTSFTILLPVFIETPG